QHGYSREYRNSPRDYSDDHWASASIQQYKDTTYYENRSGYSGSEQHKTIREHQSNKWFSENVGEYQNTFYNYGSGSVSSSNPMTAFTSDYYLNTKKSILSGNNGVISCNAFHGDAYDSLMCDLYPKTGKDIDRNLLFNENWSLLKDCWGYFGKPTDGIIWPDSITFDIGQSIKHPCSGTLLGDEYYKNRELWWVGGVSGTLTLVGNNNSLSINRENVIPNVAILQSYYSTGSYTGMCSGTYNNSINYPIWREPSQTIYLELTSSAIFNSMASFGSASSQLGFFEFIFSSIYPIIDETLVLDKDIKKTQGLTFGFCGGYSEWEQGVPWEQSTFSFNVNYNFMIPILNFSPDGNIKIIKSDEFVKPYFENIGEKWENNTIYKVSMFLNSFDEKYQRRFSTEIMINDKFIGVFDIGEAIVSLEYYYLQKYFNIASYGLGPEASLQIIRSYFGSLNISQLFFSNIYCKEYEQHEIYTIRDVRFCNKFFNAGYVSVNDENLLPNYYGSKVVNRNLKCDFYNGQLRKKISGAVERDSILINSGSDSALSRLSERPILYNVERCSKLFENNSSKMWHFQSELFPYYIP
ncbi:MAG: hypothetical protein WC554_19040, partial [Clostridia bacterium]